MAKSLSDISEALRDIDFCSLITRTDDGNLGGRPMSNNREVDFTGDMWFFTYADRAMVTDIERDPVVALAFQGSGGVLGLVGKPGIFIHVEGRARVIRDSSQFVAHWDKTLDRWFPAGPGTPGTVMIEVNAGRIHYWDGEDEGEVMAGAATTA